MTQVNIHEAKTHLSRLIEAAERGEEVIIARSGKPAVRLTPVEGPGKPRIPGALKGRIRVSDDFDAPLPEEILSAFRGERP